MSAVDLPGLLNARKWRNTVVNDGSYSLLLDETLSLWLHDHVDKEGIEGNRGK